ncbi:T9SS type B sorting domain-containing protein [Segetibacter sp. 3557_3]|uniref:T9SS type B sorting domain-containing protein n=1 Tax=Segetibacter sp. 3557_3 TaxID=2547429 RepID=UPI001404E013|nr:T9SS type B sorting domain-containing protein [Segetibacter sp. 3557_3]
MKNITLTIILLLTWNLVFGQKEWSNWYFNGRNNLTFRNNNVAQIETNFIYPIPSNFYNYYHYNMGGTSYSDKTTGQMKFLLSGYYAFNKGYNAINLDETLRICPGDQSSYHIVPFSSNPNKFYIIQFQSLDNDLAAQETGLQVRCPNAAGLSYSILDLSLNNGLGRFTLVNKIVQSGLPERISLVRHANGTDAWVIVHGWKDNQFRAYLFSDLGVAPAVTSNIGPVITGKSADAEGTMSASHDGKRLVAQQSGRNFLEFYDFNNSTGSVTNYQPVQVGIFCSRILFSPDDTKLYCLGGYPSEGLFQLDLNTNNVLNSRYKVADDFSHYYKDMQVGTDNKIYLSRHHSSNGGDIRDYLSVVNCPNLAEAACNFDRKRLEAVEGKFPVFINDFVRQPVATPAIKFSLGRDTAVCFGQHTLSAPQGYQSYRWNTGDTTRQLVITEPGDYFVLAGSMNFSCPDAYGMIKIGNTASVLDLGKDTTLCPKSIYPISVPANFHTITWNDGTTARDKMVVKDGKYMVQAYDQNGCKNRDTISVAFKYDPRANFGNDTTLCNNQTLLLKLEPRINPFGIIAGYQWQDGSKLDTFKVTRPGTYWGAVTYQNCTTSDTIQVRYLNTQSVYIGPDTTLCMGDSLTIRANIPSAVYLWSNGATTPNITVKNPGVYWVKVSNGSCTASDTMLVSFRNTLPVSLGNDTAICPNQTITLHPKSSSASYLWNDNSISDSFNVTQPGIYWVQVSENGCTGRDSIRIQHRPQPSVNLGRDTVMCLNQGLTLNAYNPAVSAYSWNDGSVSSTLLVNTPGSYAVSVTGINGCTNADTILITGTTPPSVSLGADTAICNNQGLSLQLSIPNAVYRWSTGSTSSSIQITQPGTYWVDAAVGGCTNRDSLLVTLKSSPVILLGNDTSLCEGTVKLLDASALGATYRWDDLSTSANRLVSKPGNYSVEVNVDGCVSRDTIAIYFGYKPAFTLDRDTTICDAQQFTLNPRLSNVRYLWQDGSTLPFYNVRKAGVYKLTAENSCGSTTGQVTVHEGNCKLYIPTAFTPNNDGLNDIFQVIHPQRLKVFTMKIFSRWGQVVFAGTNANIGWDGKYKGVEMPTGNYIWQMSFTDLDGHIENLHGSLMLIR